MSGGRQFDVAVIGGGLVGSAIAFGLRALGHRLLLLDEGDTAGRAASGSFGLIWVQGKEVRSPIYASLTQRSRREWSRFAAEVADATGVDVELSQRGGVHLCLSRAELDARAAKLEACLAHPDFEGYPLEVMDRRALAHLLPGLGPEVAGGTWCPLDGHCNPRQLFRGLHVAIHRAGCTVRSGPPVTRITARSDRFDIATRGASFSTEKVVLAAGTGNLRLAPMVGIDVPLRIEKGQILVLDRQHPFLPVPTTTVRQAADGSVLVGNSQEDDTIDDGETLTVQAAIAARALRLFPRLRDCNVTQAWGGLRVNTPDGIPVYAQSAAHPGAFLASCRSGVGMAALHAQVLASAVVAGALPASLEPFSIGRFDVSQAA